MMPLGFSAENDPAMIRLDREPSLMVRFGCVSVLGHGRVAEGGVSLFMFGFSLQDEGRYAPSMGSEARSEGGEKLV